MVVGGMWRGRGGILRIQSERIESAGSYLKCNTCYTLRMGCLECAMGRREGCECEEKWA
jgi:hypothetical protein